MPINTDIVLERFQAGFKIRTALDGEGSKPHPFRYGAAIGVTVLQAEIHSLGSLPR